MAIFRRKTASGGTWKTLACGDFDSSSVQADRTTVLELSDLVAVKAGLSASTTLTTVPTYGSQRKKISRRYSSREMIFTFASADSTGIEQNAIRDFFSTDRQIDYTDSERGLNESFFVRSIDDTFFSTDTGSLQITVACKDDTRLTTQRKTIASGQLAADTATISGEVTNDFTAKEPAVCELTISTPDGAAVSLSPTAVWSFERSTSGHGTWSWSWSFPSTVTSEANPIEAVVSSLDEGLGETKITVTAASGVSGRFWQIEPGESASVAVKISGSPLQTAAVALPEYKLELVCIHPRGSADVD